MSSRSSQCLHCIHLRRAPGETWVCKAFPVEIPEAVVRNQLDHRQAVPGDGGVRFEQDPVLPRFYLNP